MHPVYCPHSTETTVITERKAWRKPEYPILILNVWAELSFFLTQNTAFSYVTYEDFRIVKPEINKSVKI